MFEHLENETNAVENRLTALVLSEDNPQEAMVEIADLLEEEGYAMLPRVERMSPPEFALKVMDSPRMFDRMREIGTVGNLSRFETAIELVRWLLPKSEHLD